MSEPTELSDEALADIVHRAFNSSDENLDPNHDPWLDVARALREALCPPVAPLAPGETVTIMDARDTEYAYIKAVAMRSAAYLALLSRDGNDWAIINLDAAGVAQLEAVCRRWLAAQGGSSDVPIMIDECPDIPDEDYDDDLIERLEEEVTTLERDRALLLRYARATAEVRDGITLDHLYAVDGAVLRGWEAARQALLDAGLLEGE